MTVRMKTRRHGEGFTVIEMVVVIALVLILVGMLVPAVITFVTSERTHGSVDVLEHIHRGIVGDLTLDEVGYLGDVGVYPASLLDLVNATSTVGWHGPYITDVQLDSSVLIDGFGGRIEYFNEILSTADPDCVAIISKGPDLNSNNGLPNPNVASACTGLIPPATYIANALNLDNIAFRNFFENVTLLDYEPIGTLAYSIFNKNFDPDVGEITPGCPAAFTVTVTSTARDIADQTVLPFTPGTTDDLVQGTYDVAVTPSGTLGTGPIWQDRVTIRPGVTITKTINPSIDTRRTPRYSLEITNNFPPPQSTGRIRLFEIHVSRGSINPGITRTFTNVEGCSPMRIERRVSTGPNVWRTIDQFIMPDHDNRLPSPPAANFSKTYPQSLYDLCITNDEGQKIIVAQQGLVLGTIHRFGSTKTKCFSNLEESSLMEIMRQDGTSLGSLTNPCGGAPSCTLAATAF